MTAEPDAAVAIVRARPTESVLLMRRAERDADPWSGHWSFPGGRCDAGDFDLVETALRELAEECGIQLARSRLQAALPLAVARRRVGPFLQVAPFVFDVDDELPAVPDLREAVEAVWVPLSVLRDPARHALRNIPGVPPEVLFPAIDRNAVPLWGFTYRLITEWLGLLPEDRTAASFQAARDLLARVIAHGCRLAQDWRNHEGPCVAVVHGAIPVEGILAEASVPAARIPPVSMLEVHRDRIRLIGLDREEYVIQSAG